MDIRINKIIKPTARLPYKLIKGNAKKRNLKANQIIKQLSKNILPYCNEKECPISKLQETLNQLLKPNKISYNIKKNPESKNLGSLKSNTTIESNNKEINLNFVGYDIYLPIDDNRKTVLNKNVFIHEVRHLLDHLFNPKYCTLGIGKDTSSMSYEDKFDQLYDIFFNQLDGKKMKEFKKEAGQIISSIPRTYTIPFLQNIRYTLITEINAYNTEMRSTLMGGDFRNNISTVLNIYSFLTHNAKFKSKLKYTNDTLTKLIKEERTNWKNFLNQYHKK